MKDTEIISALKSFSTRQRDSALRYLLENPNFRTAAHAKTSGYNHGNGTYEALFEEAYADAVIDFYERIEQYDPALSAIGLSIVRFTRINFYTAYRAEQRLIQRNKNASDLNRISENPESVYAEKDRYQKALEILTRLGETCKTTLLLWFDKFSFEEIARALNRPSADAAKQATYGCRDKLNKFISDHPDFLETF